MNAKLLRLALAAGCCWLAAPPASGKSEERAASARLQSIEEYRSGKGSIADAMARGWLEYFVKKTPEISGSARQK